MAGYARTVRSVLVVGTALAIMCGCGGTSAAEGSHSFVDEDEGAVWYLGWEGDGDGQLSGSLRVTYYAEDDLEVGAYEENFTGTAEEERVTIESDAYGTLRGRVEGDRLTVEYEGDEGIEQRVYGEAPLREYERAAVDFRGEMEARAAAVGRVGDLEQKTRFLDQQADVVEEEVVPTLQGGIEEKVEYEEEFRGALEDLRAAPVPEPMSNGFVNCTSLPDLPYGETELEDDPPGIFVEDVESLGGLMGSVRGLMVDLEGVDGYGAPDARKEAQEALERAEDTKETADGLIEEWRSTERSVTEETAKLREEAVGIAEGHGCSDYVVGAYEEE